MIQNKQNGLSASLRFSNRKKVFVTVFLYLVFRNLFAELWEWNAADVLVYARHFVNPHWISNDWFLNLPIPYRFLFNVFAGTLALKMPFWAVELTGRAIIILLFAYLLARYSRDFRITPAFMLCFLALYLAYPSIVAGEWIIGGFETKCFAYFFALLSLKQFLNKRYVTAWSYLGLSVSFHVLVGIYATFCMMNALAANYKYFWSDLKKIATSSPIYLLTSAIGEYVVLKTLLLNRGINSKLAGTLYVTLRVPHHTLPSFWIKYHGGYWWVFEIAVLVLFLAAVFLKKKSPEFKIVSSFALASSLLFATGLFFYRIGKISMLKYYWFRFPDVILPFFSFFLFFSILCDLSRKNSFCTTRPARLQKVAASIKKIAFAAAFCVVLFACHGFFHSLAFLKQNPGYFRYATTDVQLREAMLWIRENTPQDGTFLINPFIEQFYMVAQRPIFVSFKHVPASDRDILEWHRRLVLCNGGVELSGQGFKGQDINRFYTLDERTIKTLAKDYKLHYLLGRSNAGYKFPIIYRNSVYAVYNLNF